MKKNKVIIIEDDSDLLSLISELCADIGCEIFGFNNIEDFMYNAHNIIPDLIITDRNLPGLSGTALIKSIRSTGEHTPILMVSGSIDVEDSIEALSLGANDYITKPFNCEVLLVKIKKILHQFDLDANDIKLLPLERKVLRGDVNVSLSESQFNIFTILLNNQIHFASREQLEIQLDTASLEANIENLRIKLNPIKIEIDTIRSKGYKLRKAA